MKIFFANNGALDPRAFKILGMSAKAEEGSIGQFGTGLKYAIAGILRLGGSITIRTMGETFEFASVPADMRGKEFHVVTCNGEELSYTTDHGKRWEPWQYFRELHSNALDEKGGTFTEDPEMDTVIEVDCKEITEAYVKRDQYFLPSHLQPIFETDRVQVFPSAGNSVYVKGVHVGKQESAYTFNFLADYVELTEDRSLKYQYQHREEIAKAMNECEDEKLIRSLLLDRAPSFDYVKPSERILDVVHKLLLKDVSVELCAGIRKKYVEMRGGFEREEIPMTEYQSAKLERALGFLKSIGYEVTAPIKLVEDEGDSIYGQAKEGEIHLMPKAFEHGVHDLVQTVLEEHAHIVTGYRDESRNLQQWLFRQVVVMGEKMTKDFL